MGVLKLYIVLTLLTSIVVESIFDNIKGQGERGINIKKFPFIASVTYYINSKYDNPSRCVGNYIQPDWILTAANCAKQMYPLRSPRPRYVIKIVMGYTPFYFPGPKQTMPRSDSQIRTVVGMYPHDNWEKNDLLLMHINKPFTYGPTVRLMPLQPHLQDLHQHYEGTYCLTAGWGLMNGKNYSTSLQKTILKVHVAPSSECPQIKNMICASSTGVGALCDGDFGAPLVCCNAIIGIMTKTDGKDCLETKYSYFVTLQNYGAWLDRIVFYNSAKRSSPLTKNYHLIFGVMIWLFYHITY